MIGIDASKIIPGLPLYGYKMYVDVDDFDVIVKQTNTITKATRKLLYLEHSDLECFNYTNKVKLENLNTISIKHNPTELLYITEASITEATVLNILRYRLEMLANEKLMHFNTVLNNLSTLKVKTYA